MESLHTIGLAILAFLAFPQLDTAHALALTNCLALVPGILNVLGRSPSKPSFASICIYTIPLWGFDIVAVLAQLSGILAWPVLKWVRSEYGLEDDIPYAWAIPLGLILASFGWWETYCDNDSKRFPFMRFMHGIRRQLILKNR